MTALFGSVIGPPGAGKGTQARMLCARFDIALVAVGDLFRAALDSGAALGQRARWYMERGELVPDELVDDILIERVSELGPGRGALFDGYPKTASQARFLDELLAGADRRLALAVYLDVPDDVALDRLASAADDERELAPARLRTHHRSIQPVLAHYGATERLAVVDADRDVAAVGEELVRLFDAARAGSVRPAGRRPVALRLRPEAPAPTRRTVDLVLLGGPGSGKGTQAAHLSASLDLPHISTGDLFRENLRLRTDLGRLAQTYMDRGELVPDEITEEMVRERLRRPDVDDGFVLDGYPRSRAQAEALDDILAAEGRRVAGAIQIAVSDEEIVRRLAGRLICRDCQASFHADFRPPRQPSTCDNCGGPLYQRADDQPQTIAARLRVFHGHEAPLLDHYRGAAVLHEIDGEGPAEEVSDRALAVASSLAANW